MEMLKSLFFDALPAGYSGGLGSGSTESMAGMDSALAQNMGSMITAIVIMGVALLILYLYFSYIYMRVGKKAGLERPGISWFNPIATIYEISGMHWWPFPVVFGGMIVSNIFIIGGLLKNPMGLVMGQMPITYTIGQFILIASLLVFAVMSIIWHWKTYETIDRPGWWILVPIALIVGGMLISLVNNSTVEMISGIIILLGGLAHVVLIGIAGFSGGPGNNNQAQIPQKQFRRQ